MFSPKKLKEKRTELGFSQAEIARKLNISRMSFSAWKAEKPNQIRRIFPYLLIFST